MKVRYQADADLKQAIVAATVRREPGIEFQSAAEAGLRGVSDPEVLAMAATEARILVTHDARTMPIHFGEFLQSTESPGVLVVPQHLPVSIAVEELVLIWVTTEASEWINRICRLPL